MDNFCLWLEKLLLWVDRTDVPPIPYVGVAGGRFHNPPAPHIEIVYALRGVWEDVRIGDKVVTLEKGHVSMHNVHLGNESPPRVGTRQSWCLFLDVSQEPEFDSLYSAPLFCSTPVADKERLESAFAGLQKHCTTSGSYLYGPKAYVPLGPGKRWKAKHFSVKGALLELLASILAEAAQHTSSGAPMPASVLRAVEFVSLHYARTDLSLGDIAEAASLTVDHFGRMFKAHMKTTPMQYLQTVRLDHSRFLLGRTDLMIEEIAHEVGYDDQFYFSRVFRKQVGVSPTGYRERSRKSVISDQCSVEGKRPRSCGL